MRRQTKAEAESEILDRAAALFAQHGFERTSIQQIADAVDYSKAGLLHHYRSKKALFEAVHDKYEALVDARIARYSGMPPGLERDRVMIEGTIDFTTEWPGMSEFAQQMARNNPRFSEMGMRVIGALGIDLAEPDLERMAKVFFALAGASFAAKVAKTSALETEWRPTIVAAALAALGHSTPPPD